MSQKQCIRGTGAHVFPTLTNAEILGFLGNPRTSEWMVESTGIEGHSLNLDLETGRKLRPEVNGVDYAEWAARMAIENAGIQANEVDSLIFTTCTPARLHFSADAIALHDRLGLRNTAVPHQIDGGCAALAQAFTLAKRMEGNVLVVASNDVSSFMNVERQKRVKGAWLPPAMFADGAGAVILGPNGRGLHLDEVYCAVDPKHPLVTYEGGGAANPTCADNLDKLLYLMNPKDVADQFAPAMRRIWEQLCKKNNLHPSDIQRLYPHQANFRLVEGLAQSLEIPMDRVAHNVDRYGNLVSAATLVALHEDRQLGLFPDAGPVIFMWVGAGMVEGGVTFV